MTHVLLLSYILLFAVASAGVLAMGFLHHRLSRVVTGSLTIAMSCLWGSLLLTLVGSYLQGVLNLSPKAGWFRHLIGLSIGIVLYLSVLRALLAIARSPRFTAIAVTAAVILVQVVRTVVYLIAPASLTAQFHIPAIALISLYLLFVGVLFVSASKRERDGTVAILLFRLGILLVVFGPVSALLYALIDLLPVGVQPYLSFDFLFMLAWSIIAISAFLRYLSRPTSLLEEGRLSDRFKDEFGITVREAEIIILLGEGLTNKEIGERIHISLATVRTHIYNVFQKTGAGNRVDLLRLASGYKD